MNICSIQQVLPSMTLAVRGTIKEKDLSEFMHTKMPVLMGYMQKNGVRPAGFTYICFNNIDRNDWDIEAGVPISQPDQGEGEVVPSSLPACMAATTMHRGGRDEMPQVYARLVAWMAEHGHEAKGPMYEICMNDPRFTPPEETYWGMWIPLKS